MSLPVASEVVKQLKTLDLEKLEDFKKIIGMIRFDGEYPAGHPKAKF